MRSLLITTLLHWLSIAVAHDWTDEISRMPAMLKDNRNSRNLVNLRVFQRTQYIQLLAFDSPEDIQQKFLYYISGYNEDGSPVWIWTLDKWDIRAYVEAGGSKLDTLEKAGDQMFVRFQRSWLENNRSASNHLTGFVSICDLDGFSLSQMGHPGTLQFLLRRFRKFQELIDHGDLKAGYMINSNYVFQNLWQLASPLLGSLTAKVTIVGNNREKWVPLLLRAIPADQLPELYGGLLGHKPVKIYG